MKNYKKWCKMIKFIFNEFEKISKKNKGKINLINIWDTEFKLEKKFKVRSKTSQKLSCQVLESRRNGGFIPYVR